ncbi:hypothetical protein [Celeribacter persicus]|jgi:hypothetical protein|uniref:Ribbon-helix-helix CopG family protein n=1 Tax=Celeribacter persicus TaxID=1651082 RepID=A0A2T5HTQ1_9RHOB|nr:hypothetical protein [Celeribacter persicus]PTQ74963.1 hypothetical protein C8N42_103255 [Celeribacter persicus]
MEKLTLLLPESTVRMLHLLARETGQSIGAMVQEMALDRYMHRLMESADPVKTDEVETVLQQQA